ncbi:MAG: GNAT family N-acetyltransferase, partial [Clostridia bacterium]|nr:GNAT family N-acetyltransferase [Clostridia bacterium]
VAKLCAVYTMPEYRGKGYMEKLLTYLIEEGKKSGIKTILNSADMKAIPLYKRVGFHTSSTIMYIDL